MKKSFLTIKECAICRSLVKLIAELHAHASRACGRSPIDPRDRPSALQEKQCLLSHFLTCFGSPRENWFNINVVIYWQLSKQGIRWPVSPDRIAGSGVDPSRSSTFLKISAEKLLVFKWSQAQVSIFKKVIWNMLCLCHYDPALLRFWFQSNLVRENWAGYLEIRAGKTFPYQGHALVTLYVQFLCSDRSNLTSEFMRKTYAASWNLFTEADRVLCQLLMFLTVFLPWMYKMKYSCYQESSVIHGWFVYRFFGWEMRRLSKSEIRFRMASFSFFTLLDA